MRRRSASERWCTGAMTILICSASGACSVGPVTHSDVSWVETYRPKPKTVEDAQKYVSAAHHKLENHRDLIEAFETATNVGTGLGVLGTVAGGLLHFTAHFVVRSTLLAGSSLGINQAYAPKLQLEILNNGIVAVACIEGKAADAAQTVRKYSAVRSASDALESALSDVPDDVSKDPQVAQLKKKASDDVSIAKTFLESVGDPSASFGDIIAHATDGIIDGVNKQLDDLRPDATVIAAAFNKALAQQPTPSATQAPTLTKAPEPQQGLLAESEPQKKADEEAKRIRTFDDALVNAMAMLSSASPSVRLDLQSCALSGTVLTFYPPDNPIELKVGTSFYLTVDGTHLETWEGSPPAEIDLKSVGTGIYELKATAATGDKSYPLIFKPAVGSPIIKIVKAVKPQ